METTNLPLFYKKPVALNSENHSAVTVAQSTNGFAFASGAHNVIIAGIEFYEACREYPIVFTAQGADKIIPVALLGVEVQENLFVDSSNGAWLGNYIPAYVRRYPFINSEGDNQKSVVFIDEEYDGINKDGGQPLFENGEPTEYLKQAMALLEDYYGQMKNTEALSQYLKKLGLLKSMDANIQLADGRSFNLTGLLVVDEEKLQRLENDSVDELFRTGILGLVYAHLISLKNISRLVELKAARE